MPGWQFIVHITPSHAGLRAAGTHAAAWQHAAGTQSLSVAHSAPSGSAALSLSLASAAPCGHETGPASAALEPPLLTPLEALSLELVQYASEPAASAAKTDAINTRAGATEWGVEAFTRRVRSTARAARRDTTATPPLGVVKGGCVR